MNNGGILLALYQSSEILISVFFNFLGGALSDQNNRKEIIWHCDIISGLICIVLAFFIHQDLLIYDILFINISLSILSSCRNSAYKAIFREIVYLDHISKINSFLENAKEVVQIAGPLGAVVVSNFLGTKISLIVDEITFIVSGLLIRKLTIITFSLVNY
ncbi:MFS transporter [Lactobacillus iners]|uniref:MFS transporter n=1 Tax=Lactobacillus iners TaxID=147802 RepID=UPI0013E10093|nr:MFS transporter [Lactobacillus iners]QIH23099.1 MFS transporter [Lactobacillus iners]